LLHPRVGEAVVDEHLPGALNIPLEELAARAAELDRSRPVVYCHDYQ
jgi:rhodanese-related sulfurtransferase